MTPHEAQAQLLDTHQHNKHILTAQWVYKDGINTHTLICIYVHMHCVCDKDGINTHTLICIYVHALCMCISVNTYAHINYEMEQQLMYLYSSSCNTNIS